MKSTTLISLVLVAIMLSTSSAAQETSEPCIFCDEAKAVVAEFGLRESRTPVRERESWGPINKIVTVFRPGALDFLAPMLGDIEVVNAGSPEAAVEHIADADVFIGWCVPGIAQQGVKLRWIQMLRAGIDSCAQHPEFAERKTVVTNVQRLLSKQIAEHAIALMLNLTRNLHAYMPEQMAGQFEGDIRDGRRTGREPLREVGGSTMLVAGLGGIGTEVARLGHALGMRVLATRNSRREGPDFVEYVGLSHELNELAVQADVVVSALPATDATREIHNAEFFSAMKESAFFVNVGRGENVDSDALACSVDIWRSCRGSA